MVNWIWKIKGCDVLMKDDPRCCSERRADELMIPKRTDVKDEYIAFPRSPDLIAMVEIATWAGAVQTC
jgi:hypothetical protein